MKGKYILTIFFLSVAMNGVSQVHNTSLKGRVTNGEKHLEGIHILNISSGYGTISNDLGLFEIDVKLNDTLLFSSLQHKNREYKISRSNIKDKFIVVTLAEQITELDEMMLHQLSGAMSVDLQMVPKVTPNKYTFDWSAADMGKRFELDRIDRLKPPDAQQLTDPIKGGAGVAATIPNFALEALYKLKREIKEKKAFRNDMINKLGARFFADELGLGEDEIYLFLDFCESESALAWYRSGNYLALIQYFKTLSSDFQKRKNE
jgi:hypothetical protein